MIVFACITALALVDSDSWQKTFLAVNLSAIAFMNVFNAVFQGVKNSISRMIQHQGPVAKNVTFQNVANNPTFLRRVLRSGVLKM